MNSYLKRYTLTLTTDSPLYIGSGKSINKKEYIYEKRNGKVLIPDQSKMISYFVKKKLLGKYEEYLTGKGTDFVLWLKYNEVQPQEYMSWVKYSLDANDVVFEDKGKKEILAFMKDAYDMPYIPGSSIKGALRTVLLWKAVSDDNKNLAAFKDDLNKKVEDYRVKRKQMGYWAIDLEVKYFNTLGRKPENKRNSVNDVMSGIRISDSQPLSYDDFILCQKVDEHIEGKENKLNILRECLKYDVNVMFDLTIDTSLCKMTPADIMNAVEVFGNDYYESFSSKFGIDRPQSTDIIYLGGGSGYASKTVTSALYKGPENVRVTSRIIDKTLSEKARREHQHSKDIQWRVSPHMYKSTLVDGLNDDMGKCRISIAEAED